MPMPPPMQSVARPFLALRFCISYSSVIEHARAGRADRMADRDRAAVDVDLAGIPAEVLVDRAGLRGERLVRLDQVEVADVPAGLLQRGARGRDRPGAHDRRIDAGMRPRHDARERRLAALGGLARRSSAPRAAAPSLMPEALAAVTVPSLSKAGRSLAIAVERRRRAFGYSSVSTTMSPLRRLDGDRNDLVLELAGLLRGLGLVLRGDRELVLLRRA